MFLVQGTNSIKTHTTKVNDTLKGNTEMASKNIGWKYPMKQINSNNNDVPEGTKEKVYSVVVSPDN
jgi:hypothetical protein